MRCASFIQPTIEECEAKSKAPTAAEKRDKIMKRQKAGDRMVYHWKDEGWLEADFLRVCGGRDQQAPHVYKHKLLFQFYWDCAGAKPLKDLDYQEIKQLVAFEGKYKHLYLAGLPFLTCRVCELVTQFVVRIEKAFCDRKPVFDQHTSRRFNTCYKLRYCQMCLH